VAESDKSSDGTTGAQTSTSSSFTTPTWSVPTVEDNTERLDLSKLQGLSTNSRGKTRTLVYAGTDYGVRKMSETVAQTHSQIQAHINRFHQLFDNMVEPPDDDGSSSGMSSQSQQQESPQSAQRQPPQLSQQQQLTRSQRLTKL
ncbi:hypothetical protein BGX28_002470, partial [Mortierella sp. GBA30]